MTEDVCIPVSVNKARQECKMIPGEECQIMEMDESYQHCSVVKDRVERRERKYLVCRRQSVWGLQSVRQEDPAMTEYKLMVVGGQYTGPGPAAVPKSAGVFKMVSYSSRRRWKICIDNPTDPESLRTRI